MEGKDMAVLFADILEELKKSNKSMEILNTTIIKLDDSVNRNSEINENLKKVCAALGSVMGQGLSGKLNMEAVEKGAGILLKFLGK